MMTENKASGIYGTQIDCYGANKQPGKLVPTKNKQKKKQLEWVALASQTHFL